MRKPKVDAKKSKILEDVISQEELPRSCRFALLGPTGAGKSTLINVLLGNNEAMVKDETTGTFTAQVHTYTSPEGEIEFLDLPGLDDPRNPQFKSYVKNQLTNCDGAIIVLKIDDRAKSEMLKLLKEIIPATGLAKMPLIGVCTHTDKINQIEDIAEVGDWKVENFKAAKAIRYYIQQRKNDLKEAGFGKIPLVPVAAPSKNNRSFDWNKAELWSLIIDAIPIVKSFSVCRILASPETRYNTALKICKIAGNDYVSAVKSLAIIYAPEPTNIAREALITNLETILGLDLKDKDFGAKLADKARRQNMTVTDLMIQTFEKLPKVALPKLSPLPDEDIGKAEKKISHGWEPWAKRFLRLLPDSTAEKLVAMVLLFRDPECPISVKVIIGGAIVYAITPLDAIPDITPILGLLDDIGVIGAAYMVCKAYIDAYIPAARKWLEEEYDDE